MRNAFTIIFNGLHHLKHNNYLDRLAPHIDQWIFVEGYARNRGSTSWCNDVIGQYDKKGRSTDGTLEYLEAKEKEYSTIRVLSRYGGWDSKDHQVNAAIKALKNYIYPKDISSYLWQIDADEQWTPEKMAESERLLSKYGCKVGMFHANYYVGKDLIAKGEWGEGISNPYRRLWDWKGEEFESHEPPMLQGFNQPTIQLPMKFNHYAYYFDSDVKFKNDYYTGHQDIYSKWVDLQKEEKFPVPINKLISGYWGRSNTVIVKDGKNLQLR